MSLVGTRPILQDELQKYELHHRARIAIKPGITGMWQVSGRSDITDFEEVVRLDKKLVIAGGSSDTDSFMKELQELAKEDDRIIFTGFVQGKILDELYSNAYIYTLPSDLEGMPLSLLEAMSYGNCCLVSDIPECTEVVEDKQVMTYHEDVATVKDSFKKMLENGVYKADLFSDL